jgi:Flp pilus assembly protein TadG
MVARRLRQPVSRLRRDERGNVAVILAAAIVPVMGLVGAAVEYSRASDYQRRLHRAADTAALAAAKHRNAPLERKREIARSVFEASMGMQPSGDPARPADRSPDGLENVWMRLDPVANGVRVEVGGRSATSSVRSSASRPVRCRASPRRSASRTPRRSPSSSTTPAR